jgi:hypothetical protein
MARSPKTPDTTTKLATPKAEVPANPPVTFSLEAVEKIVAEALAKQAEAMAAAKPAAATMNGRSAKSLENEIKTRKAFAKAGFGKVEPHEDVKTFNLWLAAGYRPVEGSKSLKINNLRLFHRSQVRPLTSEEKQAKQAELDAAVARNKAKIVSITEAHPQ